MPVTGLLDESTNTTVVELRVLAFMGSLNVALTVAPKLTPPDAFVGEVEVTVGGVLLLPGTNTMSTQ